MNHLRATAVFYVRPPYVTVKNLLFLNTAEQKKKLSQQNDNVPVFFAATSWSCGAVIDENAAWAQTETINKTETNPSQL